MFKWFIPQPTTLEALKKQYKKLAFANHPDRGGKTADMQEINSEYDELFKILKNRHETADGTEYTSKAAEQDQETPEQFRDIIAAIIHFDDLIVEICGSWLWVTGNTYVHKDDLKRVGFKFASKKRAWYWHTGEYHSRGQAKSLDEIRDTYGSERIHTQARAQLA